MTKTFHDETLFGFSNFGHWKLFDICNLIFIILIVRWTSKKANPLRDNPLPESRAGFENFAEGLFFLGNIGKEIIGIYSQ